MNKYRQISLALCAALFLTACGVSAAGESSASTQGSGSPAQSAAATSLPSEQPGSVMPGDMTAATDLDASSPLYVTGYDFLTYEAPAGTIAHTYTQIVDGDFFYILDSFTTQKSVSYYFQKITGNAETQEKILLSPSTWNVDGGNIVGMDIIDSEQCVFLVRQEEGICHAVYADLLGNPVNALELTELPAGNIYSLLGSDGQGNLYIYSSDSYEIYLLDHSGALLHSYDCSGFGETADPKSFRIDNGERVIICGAPEAPVWLRLDSAAKTLKPIPAKETKKVLNWYGGAENILYYVTTDHCLAGWDTVTDEKKLLSKLDDISSLPDILDMAVMKKGEEIRLLVTEKDQEKRYIISLSPTPPAADGQLLVANLSMEDPYFSGRVANFSMENPSYGIQYQALYQDAETDRTLLELATGGGPDILYLDRKDMESLQANGALGDLSQLIPKDTLDVLLPGAIQMGTCNGQLSAVPLSVNVRTLLTSRDYWNADTWTVADILTTMQEQEQLQGLFLDMMGADDYYYNLYFMVGANIGVSRFVENGKCEFDCQEFRDILKLIKEKTQKAANSSTPADRLAPFMDGSYLGVEEVVFNMSHFCQIYTKAGDKANLVGYPSDAGKTYYLSDCGMLAVNQNAMEKEGVQELVNYLLSLEAQQYLSYQISVRLDIPESQLSYDNFAQMYIWQSPNNKGFTLPAKEDGSSYLEEYLDFLRNAIPLPLGTDEIFNIIMEEADSYFQSGKDLDTVTDIIQKRVQLYLDERN